MDMYWKFVEGLMVLDRKQATPSECWRFAVEQASPLISPAVAKVPHTHWSSVGCTVPL